MKTTIQLLFICIFGSLLFCTTAFCEVPVKLGAPLPLTGDAVTYGTDIKNSLLFANEKLAGGKYELIFEDDRCASKQAVTAAHKLIGVDKIQYALGFACSSSVLGPAPIYEKNRVVAITSSAASSKISDAGEYIFRTYPSSVSGANILYKYIAARHARVGIISEETDFAQDYAEAFVSLNNDNKLEIFNENFLPEVTDYRSILLRLKNREVEAIVLNPQTEAGLIRLVRQIDQLQWKVARYANLYGSSPTFLADVGELANGIVFNDAPPVAGLVNSEGIKLYDEFVAKYGKPLSSDLLFVTTYIAFQSLHQAIQNGGDAKDYLANTTFDGIIGQFSFNKSGDIEGLTQVLKKIEKKEPIVLGEN